MSASATFSGRGQAALRKAWRRWDARTSIAFRFSVKATGRELAEKLDLEAAYPELKLNSIKDNVAGVRVRQHANPLTMNLNRPAEIPDWCLVFDDPTLPLHLDIGCGSGRFLLVLSKQNSSRNYLGLELREKLVHRAEGWRKELNIRNVLFLFANANASLPQLLKTYPGKVILTSILCPDPHFKKRHKKRRVMQPELVSAIAKLLAPNGKLFVESDVKEVAEDMRDQIEAHGQQYFAKCGALTEEGSSAGSYGEDGWLLESPIGVPTEREYAVLSKGGKMYRLLYSRRDVEWQ